MGEGRRRNEGAVFDVDAVVDFVFLFDSPQDGDGLILAKFADHNERKQANVPLAREILSRDPN